MLIQVLSVGPDLRRGLARGGPTGRGAGGVYYVSSGVRRAGDLANGKGHGRRFTPPPSVPGLSLFHPPCRYQSVPSSGLASPRGRLVPKFRQRRDPT